MPDMDMGVMVKTWVELNKALLIELNKFQSDTSEIPGHFNLAERPAEIQQQSSKIKVTKFNGFYFKKPLLEKLGASVLAAHRGGRPNAGTCTEIDDVNLSRDVNPTNNVERK